MEKVLLLVDDSKSMNYLHSLMVNNCKKDVNIQCYLNGKDAMNYILKNLKASKNKKGSNLILLDLNMPVMNGWEFLDEFEKLPKKEKSKYSIVILSTTQNPDDRKRAESIESCKGFISKPISEKELNLLLDQY